MQDQNILKFDSENQDDKSLKFSTDNSFEDKVQKEEKHSKLVEKNQKIYSKNDSKNFENILLCYIKELNEKTITRNQLLTQHKKTLLQLFGLGATTGEILDFLKINNFVGITEETLKEFLKKKK